MDEERDENYRIRYEAMVRAQRISHAFDHSIKLPVIGFRIGLDGLLGLIPGVGDLIGGAAAFFMVATAWRAGYSTGTVAKMAAVGFLDMLIGVVPLVGDLADFVFKGHRRMARIMEAELDREATSLSVQDQVVFG